MADVVDLIRDVLDKPIVTPSGTRVGRVDGIVVELGKGRPRVAALELGGVTPAERLPAPFRPWLAALIRRWGITRGEPYRIDWHDVDEIGIDVKLRRDVADTPGLQWERWIRNRIIRRIPGA
jgi:sporulation protein YlmC with PRC-barrel domain